ncbi:hypothetical protein ACJJI4_01225 [Microbulbifer sp. TRSA002]|uniref:hypothetical protein n=1 Tax=Microbulbifer sp. TRSA002 TaxID=3243382 RepID=UPI00403A36F8
MDMEFLKNLMEVAPELGGWAAAFVVIFLIGKKTLEFFGIVHKQSQNIYSENVSEMESHRKWQKEMNDELREEIKSLHFQVSAQSEEILKLSKRNHEILVEMSRLERRVNLLEEQNEVLQRRVGELAVDPA